MRLKQYIMMVIIVLFAGLQTANATDVCCKHMQDTTSEHTQMPCHDDNAENQNDSNHCQKCAQCQTHSDRVGQWFLGVVGHVMNDLMDRSELFKSNEPPVVSEPPKTTSI